MPAGVATFAVFLLTAALSCGLGMKYWAADLRVLERLGSAPSRCRPRTGSGPGWKDLLSLAARLTSSATGTEALLRRLARAGLHQPSAVEWYRGAQVTGAFCCGLVALGATTGVNMTGTSFAASILAACLFGFRLPSFYLGRRRAARVRELQRSLPNAIDLLIVCIESGLGLDQALRTVARELADAHPEISRELVFVNAEIGAGKSRTEALRRLADRTALEDVRDLVSALIQADRFGTSVCQALRTRSDFIRVQARQRAEEKAAKLGVKLILPIFFCVLPSLFVATLGPAIYQLMTELVPLVDNM